MVSSCDELSPHWLGEYIAQVLFTLFFPGTQVLQDSGTSNVAQLQSWRCFCLGPGALAALWVQAQDSQGHIRPGHTGARATVRASPGQCSHRACRWGQLPPTFLPIFCSGIGVPLLFPFTQLLTRVPASWLWVLASSPALLISWVHKHLSLPCVVSKPLP